VDFDFIDPPPHNILNLMDQLWVLGALNNVGGLIDLGWKMVEFLTDPPPAKMLLMGKLLGCVEEVLTIFHISIHVFRPLLSLLTAQN